jgi:hypothetical protein
VKSITLEVRSAIREKPQSDFGSSAVRESGGQWPPQIRLLGPPEPAAAQLAAKAMPRCGRYLFLP